MVSNHIEYSRDEWEKMQISCVKLILHYAAKKTQIKSADITKMCLHNDSKLFGRIWSDVVDIMSDVYGIRVNELKDERLHKFYLCTSELMIPSVLGRTVAQRCELRLLYLILAYIFMKGGAVQEKSLWSFLERLHISPERHDFFGDVKKTINETFLKQMYLKREKIVMETGDNDDIYQFVWGIRSEMEFKKKDILQSVADFIGKPIEMFAKQYQEVLSQDEEDEEVEEMDYDDDE